MSQFSAFTSFMRIEIKNKIELPHLVFMSWIGYAKQKINFFGLKNNSRISLNILSHCHTYSLLRRRDWIHIDLTTLIYFSTFMILRRRHLKYKIYPDIHIVVPSESI